MRVYLCSLYMLFLLCVHVLFCSCTSTFALFVFSLVPYTRFFVVALTDFRGLVTVFAQRHCIMGTGQVYGGSSCAYTGEIVEHGVFLIKGTALVGVHGSKESLTKVLTVYQLCTYS